MDDEQTLTGGVSADVTRIGETVRRAASPASRTIHQFLTELYDRGFTRLQRPLGFDDQGREILTYVEGRAGHPPITAELASDAALIDTARTIRWFHDLSVGYGGAGWSTAAADPTGAAEVICHNDLAPFNLVYAGTAVAAIIDWDGAAPGRRVWDLGYAAWRLVPLHRPAYAEPLGWPPLDRARRLRLFADAYGMSHDDRDQLLDVLAERQELNRRGMELLAEQGRIQPLPPSDPRAESGDTPYLAEHRSAWQNALTAD